jgi:hypothetical protein
MLSWDTVSKEPLRDQAAKPSEEGVGEFVPAGDVGDDPITRNLKKAYQEVASEPIPDVLLRLLDRLDNPVAIGGGDD